MGDYAELKRLADAATPGPWHYDNEGKPDSDTNHGVIAGVTDLWIAACYRSGTTADDERSTNAEAEVVATAKFIAAANPQTVLSMIETIQHLQARVSELEAAIAEELRWSDSPLQIRKFINLLKRDAALAQEVGNV